MFVRTFFVCSVVSFLFAGLCSGLEQVTVTGNRVNIRAVADLQSEIVGQVARGDVLSATGERKDGMVEVVPPVSVSVWVYGELIRDGEVAASSVRVRSGPGIGFRSVGKISKGVKVEALETRGDWLRIAPPSSCRVWISEAFVSGKSLHVVVIENPPVVVVEESDPAPIEPIVTTVAVEPSPAVVKKPQPPVVRKPPRPLNELRKPSPVVRSSSSEIRKPFSPVVKETVSSVEHAASDFTLETADVVQKLDLVSRAPQGKATVVSGKISPTGFFPLRRPSRYRLMISSGSAPAKTGCYLIGDDRLIASHSGKHVKVVGKKYWVQGVREPVVLVSEFCKPE